MNDCPRGRRHGDAGFEAEIAEDPTRRQLIGWGAGALLAGSVARAWATPPTEEMTIGPFYPVMRPLDQDGDLTVVGGNRIAAKGKIVHLAGRVLRPDGSPAPGARIEIWQANSVGRYAHPADTSTPPIDAGFQGFGVQSADAEGRYRFKTIMPGAYTIPDGRTRAPHIHFDVQGRATRIITQMFFPGEPLNGGDFLFKEARNPASLIAHRLAVKPDGAEAVLLNWDIVLNSG